MMKLTICAAALIAVAAFVTIPASAEYIGGGPRVNTEGKCWKDTGGLRDGRYGTWVECPKKASIADSTCQTMNQLQWEKAHVGFQYFDVCVKGAGAVAAAKPKAR
jgi:hypothetical protein